MMQTLCSPTVLLRAGQLGADGAGEDPQAARHQVAPAQNHHGALSWLSEMMATLHAPALPGQPVAQRSTQAVP